MIVVDASVILHVLTNAPTAQDLITALEQADELAAPALIDLEVMNGIRKHALSGRLNSNLADTLFLTYCNWAIEKHAISHLSKQIWALRHNLTPYDASYVCLAANLGVALLTRDTRLASAANAIVRIELV